MSNNKNSYLGPLFIIGIIFFIMGFVTWVNGTLISFFKKAFSLDNTSSYLVTFAFFISYTVMAIPCSMVVKKTGFKNGMSLALLVMAVGTIIFIPAAEMASYNLFLVALFTIGIGLTVLQTASNPYVTILGPRESAAQRISVMGIANKTAGVVSQLIFGRLLLAGAETAVNTDPTSELDRVVTPYIILTIVLVVLAIVIRMSKGLVEVSEEEEETSATTQLTAAKTSVVQYPNLVLGVLAIFCYVGVEVIAGDTIIAYGLSLGFAEEEARLFGTYTLYGMMFGYVLGVVLIPKYVSQQAYLKFSAVLGLVVTVAAIFTSGFTSVVFIAILGFANAVIWPALWPLALSGLGKFTKLASALLVMGISGGAVIPLLYGGIADSIGSTQMAYWIMVPLYLYILYFGLVGHKKKSW